MTIREKILGADDLPRELVPTPEWPEVDGQVYARRLSGDELDLWEVFIAHQVDQKALAEDDDTRVIKMGTKHIRATLVAMGACDENGRSIFTEADIVALGAKASDPLDRLRKVIRRLSGMDDDKEETAKNLPEAPGDSSSTDSPSPLDMPVCEGCSES